MPAEWQVSAAHVFLRAKVGKELITKAPTPARVGTYLAEKRLRTGGERCSHADQELREGSLSAHEGESLHLRDKQQRKGGGNECAVGGALQQIAEPAGRRQPVGCEALGS